MQSDLSLGELVAFDHELHVGLAGGLRDGQDVDPIGQPGIMAKAASALAADGINILAVSQTARQTNMQFVVERSQFAKAQIALHAALCMSGPRTCMGAA